MKTITLAGEFLSGLSKEAFLILRTMRPLEWIKNLFVFAPVFFSGESRPIGQDGPCQHGLSCFLHHCSSSIRFHSLIP